MSSFCSVGFSDIFFLFFLLFSRLCFGFWFNFHFRKSLTIAWMCTHCTYVHCIPRPYHHHHVQHNIRLDTKMWTSTTTHPIRCMKCVGLLPVYMCVCCGAQRSTADASCYAPLRHANGSRQLLQQTYHHSELSRARERERARDVHEFCLWLYVSKL